MKRVPFGANPSNEDGSNGDPGIEGGSEAAWPHDDTADPIERSRASRALPWREACAVSLLIVIHLAIVLWSASQWGPGYDLLRMGGLRSGSTLEEPWRLVTSLLLHADVPHVLWNGLSMIVFAVPLLTDLGYARTSLIYLAAGIGGGLTALAVTGPGTIVIGSSGAVAGLFGAWVMLALRYARRAVLVRRARLRTMGVALLVLPAFLNPTAPGGQPISLASHVGGLATGLLIGAVISVGLLVGENSGGSAKGELPDATKN